MESGYIHAEKINGVAGSRTLAGGMGESATHYTTTVLLHCIYPFHCWRLQDPTFQKGFGYHLDLLVVGLLIFICSMLGLPFFVAATILSITHVQSLRMESETAAPGEKPLFLGVR